MCQNLASLAPSQPYSLSVLLQLRDQCIAMFHHIGILLILVIRSVRLDNPVHPVNRACDTVARNEFRQIPVVVSLLPFPFFFFFFFFFLG